MDQPKHNRGHRRDAAGSALLISIMVMVVVTLLGITYLFQADTENLIARNERDRAQTLGIAEAGARMVKSWFDRPIRNDIGTPSHLFLNTHDMRRKKFYDVGQRLINDDGDPGTAPLPAANPAWVYYMEGVLAPGSPVSDTNPNHSLDFFQKPYRGSFQRTLLGTEDGPDLRISEDSASADVRTFLDDINGALFTDTRETGRITRIELYEPPYVNFGGTWERFGIGTVKVTAAKFRPAPGGGEEKIAERVVKMVLNEAPYPGPAGPLQSCQGIEATGSFEAHWGKVTALADIEVKEEKWASAIPWDAVDIYPNLEDYRGAQIGEVIADPWLSMRCIGFFEDADCGDPLPWVTCPGYTSYTADPSAYDPDDDHSNLSQSDTTVTCPDMPYELWKSVAKDGGKNVHYLTWVAGGDGDLFRSGISTKTFQEWTHNQTGLFFFDTKNNKEADATNLTPAFRVQGSWFVRGFIYMNVENFRTTGMNGTEIVMVAPGEPFNDIWDFGAGFNGVHNIEPFDDLNGNKVMDDPNEYTPALHDQGWGTANTYDYEPWVNIDYGTGMTGGGEPPDMEIFDVNPGDGAETASFTRNGITTTRTTTNARDRDGLPVVNEINMYGVIYNSGAFSAQGNGRYYGSVVAAGGVGEDYFGAAAAGNPNIYFDERLIKGDWPPPELELPLTIITVWKTDS